MITYYKPYILQDPGDLAINKRNFYKEKKWQ